VAVLLLVPRFLPKPYHVGVMVWCGIHSLVCMGLSLFMGYCGQISLGHAGFCAVGAYMSGILTTRLSFSPSLALLFAFIISMIIASAAGMAALRVTTRFGSPPRLATVAGTIVSITVGVAIGLAAQWLTVRWGFRPVGSDASGIQTMRLSFSPWLALLAALVVTLLLGLAAGMPALRLRGHYLAMATLGFGVIIYVVVRADPGELTGGPSGFGGIPRLFPEFSIFGLVRNDEERWYYFVWGILIVLLVLLLNLVNSRVGRALRSIHGGETAAKAMGVNTGKYKIQAFLLSAAMASVAGSFYAHYVRFVNPDPFSLVLSIEFVTMVVVGGMTNLWGAIAGATVLTILTRYFRVFKEIGLLFDGLILIVVMLLFSEGLFVGGARRLSALVRSGCSKIRYLFGGATKSA